MDDMIEAYQRLTSFAPNPMQERVWQKMEQAKWGIGLLLKAPTGSGKTEAVSVPILAKGDRRLIMVYPTRSLVEDQIGRFEKMLAALSQTGSRVWTLVVDTGAESLRRGWHNGNEIPLQGNTRRHLYQGDVIITTLDKLLYRFFGFGEPGKSYTFPLRIHYGAKKTLICFDEAHSYDDIAFTNFNRLTRTLYEKAVDVVLMTATMPPEFAREFENYLEVVDFVHDANDREMLDTFTRQKFSTRIHPEKHFTYFAAPIELPAEDDDAPSVLVNALVQATKDNYSNTRRLIVTAERVRDAVAVYRALQTELPQAELLLYHGRLTAKRRKWVYEKLKAEDDANKNYLLVSTSAIEVGCDLNAHVLISQLCDPERLIQRAGRCNRKQEISDAQIIVIGDSIPDWLTGLSAEALMKYKQVLNTQNGKLLDTLAIAECIEKRVNPDYRVEMMFDMLHEYVYEARLENRGLHEKGLVITRSWEPTITLCTEINNDKLTNALEVPIRRCYRKSDEPLGLWDVFKETFDWHERKPVYEDVGRWDCAYGTDLIAKPQHGLYEFDESVGYVELPKLFNNSFPAGYRRVLERVEGNEKRRVWYLDPQRGDIEKFASEQLTISEEEETGEEDAD